MSRRVTHRLLITTAVSAASLTWPSLAAAQAGAGPAVVDELVVTAQKRAERLLDVPVAVTAVQSETLVQQNLLQVRDYYARIPSLAVSGGGTEQRASSLSLRGVTTNGGTAATVAITVDDVPFTSGSFLAQSPLPDLDPADLDRIEVLRGPQGTLYGASSLGGLIKYVTTSPDPNDFTARVEAGVNTVEKGDSGYSLRGSLNVPIVDDRVALRLSAFTRRDPPFIDNIHPLVNKADINDNKTGGGRIALFVQPVDALTLDFSAMRQHTRFNGSPSLRVCTSCGNGPYRGQADFNQVNGDLVSDLGPTTRETTFSLYQARGTLDVGFADLTSISAWGRFASASDLDTTNVFGFLLAPPFYNQGAGATTPILNTDKTKKFSQEVRLASKADQRLEWLVGGFYTKEDILVRQTVQVRDPSGAPVADALASDAPSTFEEKAVFADLTYHFTDKFDVQVGGRYSKNDQDTGGFTIVDGRAQPIFGPNSVTTDSGAGEDSTTWLITPRYRFSPDLMAYARIATGYRPGGPNPVLPNIPATFGSDKVTSYELGLKGQLPVQKLTFDLALFQVDWDDVQLQAADVATQFSFFTNGSTARSRGLEVAAAWRPLDGLAIDGNATFTDAELTDDVPQPQGASTLIGFKGERLPGSAKFVGNLSAQKDWEIGHGFTAYLGGGVSYVGGRLAEFPNILPPANPAAPNRAFGARLRLPSYTMVDLRMGVHDDDWTVNAYVRNLFDKRAVLEATTRGATSSPRAVFTQPRTYGLTVSRQF